MDFERLLKLLDDSGVEYTIDDNPSEERVVEIKIKIEKQKELFKKYEGYRASDHYTDPMTGISYPIEK